ncbi:hypothetical protein [Cetobacterium sp.]
MKRGWKNKNINMHEKVVKALWTAQIQNPELRKPFLLAVMLNK